MKTPFIIVASVLGVIATAGAAMAVNAGALAFVGPSDIGNAPTTLIESPQPTTTPEPSPTGWLDDDQDSGSDDSGYDDSDSPSGGDDADDHEDDGSDDSGSDDSGSDDSGSDDDD